MRSLETKLPAPLLAAFVGASMKFYATAWGIVIDPTPWRMQVGVGIAVISGLLALVATATLWRARTTLNPYQPARAASLVTGGVFRLSRNPLYLSLLLLLVAYAIRLDSPAVWLAPVLFLAYVTRFQIRPEERALEAKFGQAYQQYRMRTRRWL